MDHPVLKSNGRPITAKRLMSFDTEDDSKGNVKQISLYDGTHHWHFKKRDRFRAHLLNSVEGRNTAYCVATNLEYDLLNTFGDHMSMLNLRLKSGGSTMVSARLKGTRMTFYDSLNHALLGVKAMGDKIGLPKLDMNLRSWEYVDRDAEITYRFSEQLQESYNRLGCSFNATLPSSALDLYRRGFLPFAVRQPERRVLEFLTTGYYGGRVEAFDVAPFRGSVWYIDVNSMYPFVMRGVYPNPNRYAVTTKRTGAPFGVYRASVKVPKSLYFSPLAFRDGKLFFPAGSFTGVWASCELDALKERGGSYRILYGVEFDSPCIPFRSYVDYLYPLKQSAKDEVDRTAVKLLLNSLYGKFGELVQLIRVVDVSEIPDDVSCNVYGDLAYIPQGSKYPPHSNVIWSLWTTAQARLVLLRELERLRSLGARVLYCDTDSIIYGAEKPLHLDSKALGEWHLEGRYTFAHFLGPKLYCLDDGTKKRYRAKGVPQSFAPQFFDEGTVSFSRPYRMKSALRLGLRGTSWGKFTKTRQAPYDKRKVLDSGETECLYLRR